MSRKLRLVIASNNKKKRREIAAILSDLNIDIVPEAQTTFVDVVENGDSFAANAAKKAEAFAAANHLPALADDSGLEVDALGGRPGVLSSRYAGKNAVDTANNARLLAELADGSRRGARFVCAVHLAFPDSTTGITARGEVYGAILEKATGTGGFGYDPLFFCPELGKTFAEAAPDEKARVSHRGRALAALAEKLKALQVAKTP